MKVMETNSSSDGEDEVFFGPILAKEVKKASKLRRATQLFLPNFRENLNTSSDSSQCEDEGTASMSVEVVEATDTGRVTNSDYLTEASHVTEAGLEQLTQSQTKRIHNGENVTKQEVKSLAHQQIVNNLKEAVPSCPTPSSPFPKIIELTKNEKNDSEQEESPFQKKSKALLDLIHRAREDLSSPTHSPSNVSLSESGSSSAMKRKNISSSLQESTSPVWKKITKTSLDAGAVQIPKGGACYHETKAKFPSAPKVTKENVSHCLEGSSPDVQTLKSEPNDGCLKDLSREFTAADRLDDDGQIRSDLNAGEEQKADEIIQCINLNTVKVSEKQKLNSYQGMINDRHQTKDCLHPRLVSAFSRIEHKPSSDSSVNKSLTNHLDLGGHGLFRNVGDVDSQLDPFLSKQHSKFENKENLVDKYDQPDYETVSQDEQDNHGVEHDGNIPQKTLSPAMQAFRDCSNSMVGHCGRQGDLIVNGKYINPDHTMSGNYSKDAVTPDTIMNLAKPLYADSQMSLRRKVLEEKKAQLMKLKQAKENLKHQLLQDKHKQALQGSVPSFEIHRPVVAAGNKTEAFPTRTLDEARIDELTRYYTWKNSQLQDNSPLDSQCSIKQEKPHLRWTDNLVVEVTELSSPREPSQRGKSILSKRL